MPSTSVDASTAGVLARRPSGEPVAGALTRQGVPEMGIELGLRAGLGVEPDVGDDARGREERVLAPAPDLVSKGERRRADPVDDHTDVGMVERLEARGPVDLGVPDEGE